MKNWTVAMASVIMACMGCMAMTITSVYAAGAPACSSDLSPYKACMPAVLGAAPPLPTFDCCKAIKGADIACLCTAVAKADIPALNQDAALMLPKHCGAISPGSQTCAKHEINSFARKLMDLH